MANNDLKKFISFVNSVIKAHGMYFVNNVEDIYLIMFGYAAASNNGIDSFLQEFRIFINKEFESTFNHDWVRLLRFHSGGDLHSIELFKIKFQKFLDTQGDLGSVSIE